MDFLAKAQAATQRVTASAAVQQHATPEQARLVQEITQDRPTIHAAVTSYLSLVAARSLVAQSDVPPPQQPAAAAEIVFSNAEALQSSRVLLKAINGTTMSATPPKTHKKQLQDDKEEEYSLVAQLWNGLIASGQKPARLLGRRALQHAWSDIRATQPGLQPPPPQQQQDDDTTTTTTTTTTSTKLAWFVNEFERLLFLSLLTPGVEDGCDNDAALLWALDGGTQELQKRRDRRHKRATEAAAVAAATTTQQNSEEEAKMPFIEEIPEE